MISEEGIGNARLACHAEERSICGEVALTDSILNKNLVYSFPPDSYLDIENAGRKRSQLLIRNLE